MANKLSLRGATLRLVLTLACLMGATSRAYGANLCPWLNEATASGLLGVDAEGTYVAGTDGQPATCTFTEKDEGGARSLAIVVENSSDPRARMSAIVRACVDSAAPLTAIGNEAVSCAADNRRGQQSERAIGHVRGQVFTITIKSTMKDDPILTRDALKTRIYTAAEQVAGNLF
jgi:hypothetical protein